jgi:hypothetical protein
MSNEINCYNPGYDITDNKKECPAKKTCDTKIKENCMYTTQGEYICQKIDEKRNIELGVTYIIS